MTHKFKENDRIEVIKSGLLGTITGIAGMLPPSYLVEWDGFPQHGSMCYTAFDVDDLWAKIDEIKDAHILSLPHGVSINTGILAGAGGYGHGYNYGYDYGHDPEDEKKKEEKPKSTCEHKWVDIGLTRTRMVCYHCGIDKPE